jgi:hypothetical protein
MPTFTVVLNQRVAAFQQAAVTVDASDPITALAAARASKPKWVNFHVTEFTHLEPASITEEPVNAAPQLDLFAAPAPEAPPVQTPVA